MKQNILKVINLALLILFPLAWFAPLMRAGFLPLFGLSEISVITGLKSLWTSDIILALLVMLFAIVAPYLKTIGLTLVHLNYASTKLLPVLFWVGKIAMADIFIIALYVVVIKSVGIGKVEIMWGLYFFTACILSSIVITALTPHFFKTEI